MTITQLVEMAETIHNAEGYDLGASSTRDYRNAFWARVVGCAYWGHPTYNPIPDRQWHIKKASPSSQQSDDVVVSMPTRWAWDCIPGAGAGTYDPENDDAVPGYRFEKHELGALPAVQVVYAPPKPDEIAPVPIPPAPVYPPYPGDAVFDQIGVVLFADYAAAWQAPNPQMGRWFGRTIYDWLTGICPTLDASITKHRAEWRAVLGLPPL